MIKIKQMILALFILAVMAAVGACTKKFSVAPLSANPPTHTPTQTHTPAYTFTPSRTPTPHILIITTGVGSGVQGYTGDGGTANTAMLFFPTDLTFDSAGNLYIADTGNNVIRKVNTSGIITTVAGTGTAGYTGDGGPAISAELSEPYGIAIDSLGNIFIADTYNSVIRKVDTGGIITTMAGNGTAGYAGDGGPATSAEMNFPFGVAVDFSGNLYITDSANDRIRKVDTGGIITTAAGNGTAGNAGDGGPAVSAELFQPAGIAIDPAGNLYNANYSGSVIRKVNTGGIITTVAGTGTTGYAGDGGPATSADLFHVFDVAVDPSGILYIVDTSNNVVRKVDTGGIITTMAGTGTAGYTGDGGAAVSAQLDHPYGVAVDSSGNIYIADSYNHVIRKVY